MIGWLLKFINPLQGIAEQVASWDIKRRNAANDQERIAAEQRIAQLEARATVLKDTTWFSPAALVQTLWALPFIVYNGKVIVWDKVLGWGVTDALGPFEQNLGLMIAGFYFLSITGAGIIRAVRR